jgi:5'-phosphate synthase pdxT subunit
LQAVENRPVIGVLALQGGFALHLSMVQKAGAFPIEVRYPEDLDACDALILPGGESTTLHHLIGTNGLFSPLVALSEKKPLFGTCAGMILMSRYNILDIAVQRNAFGRQKDSFRTKISMDNTIIDAVFIRAPRIKAVLSSNVQVLASYQGEPICVQQGLHLGCSFHPELTSDLTIHQYFVRNVAHMMKKS